MSLIEITPPGIEPVSRDEMKIHLKVETDVTEEDTLIDGLITAARLQVEGFLRRRLITQVVELRRTGLGGAILLPVAPVQDVVSITYLDTSNVEHTLAADQYRLVKDCQPWRIIPAHLVTWPAVLSEPDTVGVRVTVGYGDLADDVPRDIRVALMMIVAHMFENREAVALGTIAAELPFGPRMLLAPHIFWI